MVHRTHNAAHDERNEHIEIYVNGDFLPRAHAKISVFDRVYLVGDGVWEGIKLHQGKLVFIEDHLKRMWQAAMATGIKLPWSQKELTNLIYEVCHEGCSS